MTARVAAIVRTVSTFAIVVRVLIAGVALCAIPTAARAHGGNDDPNVVHACIGNVTKIVRSVGVAGSCIAAPLVKAETPAHWAIKGQDGRDGLNGTSVSFVDYFSGSAGGCLNGGAIYAAGDPPVNVYVCNGTNGVDGRDGKDGTNATRADGPCFDNEIRYVDCGNGTVFDTVTGLIWLKQWDCLAITTWASANQAAAGVKNGDCGLTDNSSAGDWRLPTQDEWGATIAGAAALGCLPSWTTDQGELCYGTGVGSSFAGMAMTDTYWSSTPHKTFTTRAWSLTLDGNVNFSSVKRLNPSRVWPVRRGSR